MFQFIMRVRLINGSFAEVPIHAISSGMAITILESQFGPGTYMGTIDTNYIDNSD